MISVVEMSDEEFSDFLTLNHKVRQICKLLHCRFNEIEARTNNLVKKQNKKLLLQLEEVING